MDGAKGESYWHYAVGVYRKYSGSYFSRIKAGIPGPTIHSEEIVVQTCELYVFDISCSIHKYAAMLHHREKYSGTALKCPWSDPTTVFTSF